MSEWKQLISEWLNEYVALQENEIKSFAAEHEHNHEIATALFNMIYSEDQDDDHSGLKDNEAQFDQVTLYLCNYENTNITCMYPDKKPKYFSTS